MADDPRLAVAILAAGSSQRFGDADKLTADFRGEMLGLRVARELPLDVFDLAFVVISGNSHPCAADWRNAGLDVLANSRAEDGMGTSVALAAARANDCGMDALIIVLADMPMVPASHYEELANGARALGSHGIVVSSDGRNRSPPACFGRNHFEKLAQLGGDVGARAILSEGTVVTCPAEWLVDVDTPEALTALRSLN
ncbi:MAG: nucleotidyltransferase family protein [Pseudomonadota bacterium]